MTTAKSWGVLWRSKIHRADDHLVHRDGVVALFGTREEAESWSRNNYGYIRDRPDLRAAPHGWRMPKAVRVAISVVTKEVK